jgi:hypothetical protein
VSNEKPEPMKTVEQRLQNRIYVSLYTLVLVMLIAISLLFAGCSDRCEVKNEYIYYKPVYRPLSEIRSSVEVIEPQAVVSAGRIYIKDEFLFVNQPGEGIHIVDNTNPSQPLIKSFINIPGNFDLAVKGNILYADSYIDLLALDISDINNIIEVKRLEGIFVSYNPLGFNVDPEKGLITGWVEDTQVEVYESDCDASVQPWGGIFFEDGIAVSAETSFNSRAAITPGNGSVSGVGGSMARFTINNNFLYTLDGENIQAINIESESNPVPETKTPISWDMETIFPYKDKLFIGSMSGMHIIDVSEPAQPVMLSTYQHLRVCDPVVVQGNLAFVTLRSGTDCQGFTNQMEVINIENLLEPQLLETYPMTNPHGLGIDKNTLFICDGDAGLKVYDAADITKIDENQLAHYDNINAFDVIPLNNNLIMIGEDGIFQYDYSDPANIKLLSKIAIVNDAQ